MSATLGLYPDRRRPRTLAAPDGMTFAQAAEVARIQARYGRVRTWPLSNKLLAVALVGDSPLPNVIPAQLVLAPTGVVVARQRASHQPPNP